jgi:glycosyltransferase involved in cell wall biosynthesis
VPREPGLVSHPGVRANLRAEIKVPADTITPIKSVGVVLIGRNEGERLRRALESLTGRAEKLVYVDSGSTDASVTLARSFGAVTVELDLRRPFTAARARNEGFAQLMALDAGLDAVFFVDGDCEVAPDWLTTASDFLSAHPQVGVVWGLRRERFPDESVYNALCDIEWQGSAAGEVKHCGGDALIRVAAFQAVGGYRPDLICGEEPEMCVRLRAVGWLIWHLKVPMTVHDAAIFHFAQYWKRMVRAGYAFANGAALHGAPPELHGVRESRRAWVWAFFLPLSTALAVAHFGWWGLLPLICYPIQLLRLARASGLPYPIKWVRASTLLVGKFAELCGQLKFLANRLLRTQARLIEYK